MNLRVLSYDSLPLFLSAFHLDPDVNQTPTPPSPCNPCQPTTPTLQTMPDEFKELNFPQVITFHVEQITDTIRVKGVIVDES